MATKTQTISSSVRILALLLASTLIVVAIGPRLGCAVDGELSSGGRTTTERDARAADLVQAAEAERGKEKGFERFVLLIGGEGHTSLSLYAGTIVAKGGSIVAAPKGPQAFFEDVKSVVIAVENVLLIAIEVANAK